MGMALTGGNLTSATEPKLLATLTGLGLSNVRRRKLKK
jgi:hypothetical protein